MLPNKECRHGNFCLEMQIQKTKKPLKLQSFKGLMEATPRFELGNKGFADLCLTTWLCRRIADVDLSAIYWLG